MPNETSVPLAALRPGVPFFLVVTAGLLLGLLLRVLLMRVVTPARFHKYTRAAEESLLTVLFLSIVLFSCLQLCLRNFFHKGLIWIDPLLRYVVLWIGFLGALAAASKGRHIAIDLLSRILPQARVLLHRVAAVGASVVCLILANGAYQYLQQEYQFGRETILGMKGWQLQSIFLIGFILLAYRFLVYLIWGVRSEPEGIVP